MVVSLAVVEMAVVSLAIDAADLSTEATEERVIFSVAEAMVISLVIMERANV